MPLGQASDDLREVATELILDNNVNYPGAREEFRQPPFSLAG
jgi:hypothetical protein